MLVAIGILVVLFILWAVFFTDPLGDEGLVDFGRFLGGIGAVILYIALLILVIIFII